MGHVEQHLERDDPQRVSYTGLRTSHLRYWNLTNKSENEELGEDVFDPEQHCNCQEQDGSEITQLHRTPVL